MKHYDSIPRIQDDGTLIGEYVYGFNKLDGQNFCVKYNPKTKEFGPFGSRRVLVDETSEQFGDAVRWFKNSNYQDILREIVKMASGKKGIFNGVKEITFFFEWYGDNSFAGFHQEGDNMHLALIDVNLHKKGYLEPDKFIALFKDSGIEIPDLVYKGILTNEIIDAVKKIDSIEPVEFDEMPSSVIKEGVVFKRSTMMKGQKRPSVKVKTSWWLQKLHEKYDEETCKELE